MDSILIDIEEVATKLLEYINGRRNGSYTGHSTIEENLSILHNMTGEALREAKINPNWNEKPFQF